MRRGLLLACLAFLSCGDNLWSQGRLQRVREEVNPPAERPEEPEPTKKEETRHESYHECCHDDDWSIFAFFFGGSSSSSRCREYEESEPAYAHYCPRYPYRQGYPGLLTVHPHDDLDAAKYWGGACMKSCWGQLTLEEGWDSDDLSRTGGLVRFDTSCRLGLVAHWNYYRENLPGPDDSLMTGDANVTLRFIDSCWWQSHIGLGCRWLADRGSGDSGFNLHWGNDVFPLRPFVLSGEINTGWLGEANVTHLRGTIGVVHRHVEVFSGYDYLRIGDVRLQGPLIGLRIWF